MQRRRRRRKEEGEEEEGGEEEEEEERGAARITANEYEVVSARRTRRTAPHEEGRTTYKVQ